MKINGLMNHPRWYDIKCRCSDVEGDVENQHPISPCLHCKFQEQEDSMPREDFVVEESDMSEEGVAMSTTHEKTVNEITIVRGKKFQEIIGWYY